MRAFLAVARNEITQILRDKVYLLLMTVGPMISLVTFAYTLSTDIEQVRTLAVNLDAGQHGRQFVQALANDRFFDLEMVAQREDAERRLQVGSARVVVVIPGDYSQHVDRGEPVQVQVIIDGSEPGVAMLARNHVVAAASSVSQQLMVKAVQRGGAIDQQGVVDVNKLEFRPRVRYNADLKTVIGVLPALMYAGLTVPAVGASAAFARERERGTFEVVVSTPLGRWPLLLGRVFPYVLLGLFDIGIFAAIARFVFGLPQRGALALLVMLGCVYVFATASIGVFIAQFLRTQHGAVIVMFELLGIMPMYLSDVFFPIVSMPAWLQGLSALLPVTHFNIIARGIFLKGVGWQVLWPNALAMLATGVVMSGLAYTRFRKKVG
ncbi:MAG: ABC transporter permease [Anaerolineae bacterium]|nr:ABC transporter permease [Anaerolineae bacterium]